MVELQDRNVVSLESNQQMVNEIRREQELVAELEDKNDKLESKRREMLDEIQVCIKWHCSATCAILSTYFEQELESRLDEEEDANVSVSTAKRKLEVELDKSKVRIEDMQQEMQTVSCCCCCCCCCCLLVIDLCSGKKRRG